MPPSLNKRVAQLPTNFLPNFLPNFLDNFHYNYNKIYPSNYIVMLKRCTKFTNNSNERLVAVYRGSRPEEDECVAAILLEGRTGSALFDRHLSSLVAQTTLEIVGDTHLQISLVVPEQELSSITSCQCTHTYGTTKYLLRRDMTQHSEQFGRFFVADAEDKVVATQQVHDEELVGAGTDAYRLDLQNTTTQNINANLQIFCMLDGMLVVAKHLRLLLESRLSWP